MPLSSIPIQQAKISRLHEVDTKHLPFGKYFSDHMFVVDYIGNEWIQPRIIPFGEIGMLPSLSALHYGQSLFEGMKAHRSDEGDLLLFRPLFNLARMNQTAERMCMPKLPKELFMEGLTQLLKLDREWVLPDEGCSLYIRPVMFATDETIGVKPSENFSFIIFTSPSGPYFTQPLKVLIETHYSRACEGGVGFAKVAGNYGVALFPTKAAQEKGYHQLIWTDAKEHKYIEESGMMNVMFVIDNKLVTPSPSAKTILEGNTRDALVTVARDFGLKVEERRVSVAEIIAAIGSGTLKEAFGAGTAATVAPIVAIGFEGNNYELPPLSDDSFAKKSARYLNDLRRGRIEDVHKWIYRVA